jgi:ATP-binding cassette subfamily B protein
MVPRRFKWALGGAALLMALASACATAVPLVIGYLIDGIKDRTAPPQATGEAVFQFATYCLVGIAGLVLLREGLHVFRRYLVESTCTRIDKHMSVRVVSHLLQVELSKLTHEKIGALHGRIFRGIDGYMRLLRMSFLEFFPALLTGIFALMAALTKQPWVGLAMVGVIPISLLLTAWQLRSQKGVRIQLNRRREDLDGTVVEQLGGIDYVRVSHTLAHEVKRVARVAEKRRRKELKHHVTMSLFGAAKALTEGLFHMIVLGSGVYLAVSGRISYGTIFTFSMLFMGVMTPLAEIHRVFDEGHEASLRVGDLVELLTLPVDPSFTTLTHREPRLEDGRPVFEANGLCVEYASSHGQSCPVLGDVSLAIHPGETVGIVGRTGCGKSTLLKVMIRLLHPTGGRVFLKGVPLEEVSREAISKLVGYVGQAPFMFAGTIEENITYGCTGPFLPEEVRRAAQRACIHEEIMRMPEGYAAEVAERGQNLSGGQRQRLALARVFLKDPPVLILDEATSALDNIIERRVQKAIEEARADRTVILVAHRLSTLTDADRILVFDQGRIAETGSYDELVKRGGHFSEMVFSAENHSSPPADEAGSNETVARSS